MSRGPSSAQMSWRSLLCAGAVREWSSAKCCHGTRVNLASASSQPTWFNWSAHTGTICGVRTVWSECAEAQTADKWRTWDLRRWKRTAISCWGCSWCDLSSGTAFLLDWDTSGGTAQFKAHSKCWWGGAGRARAPGTSTKPQGSMCPSPPRAVLFCAGGGIRDAAPTPNTSPVHRHTWHRLTWKPAWETDPN